MFKEAYQLISEQSWETATFFLVQANEKSLKKLGPSKSKKTCYAYIAIKI